MSISIIKCFHNSKKKKELLYGGGSNEKDNSINNSLKGNLDQNILVTYIKLTILKYNWRLGFVKEQNNIFIKHFKRNF